MLCNTSWRYAIVVLLWAFTTLPLIAQPGADTLLVRLRSVEGTQRVDVLNALGYAYIAHDDDKAQRYCNQALDLARELRYNKGIATAYAYRGVYEYLSGKFQEADKDFRAAVRQCQKMDDKALLAYTYLQMGNHFMNQTILDSTARYYELSYELLKDSTNPVNLSKLYKNMGTMYGLRSETKKQIHYLKRTLAIRKRLGERQLIADAFIELGRIAAQASRIDEAKRYLHSGDSVLALNKSDLENLNDYRQALAIVLLSEGHSDAAFALMDSAKAFYQKSGLAMKNMSLHVDMGTAFADRGEYELALKSYYTGLRIAESGKYYVQRLDILVRIGWVDYHLRELVQAQKLAEQVLVDARIKLMPDRRGNALTLLGVTLTELRQYQKAGEALHEVLDIRQKTEDPAAISEAYLNLGYLDEVQGRYPEAKVNYRECHRFAELGRFRLGMAWSYLGLGTIAFREHDYSAAAKWLDQAESIARPIHANEILIRTFETKRDLLTAQYNYREALRNSVLADDLKDSLHRNDLARRFSNLQKMEEIEQRDRSIRLLEQERTLAEEKIALQQNELRTQYGMIATGIVGMLLLAATAIVYASFFHRINKLNKTISEKNENIQRQASELLLANQQLEKLYQAVSEQKEEIQIQSEELTGSYRQIQELNMNLQNLVDEKTADLTRTNHELVKQNEELMQFSYTVSHNLRGPVARLMGLASILQSTPEPDEKVRMSKLVFQTSVDLDQVLRDISKIIDARNELHRIKETIDLASEWQRSNDMLRDIIPHDATVAIDIAPDAVRIFTIRSVIQSLFYNLLSNAIKYRSPDRPLSVNAIATLADSELKLEFTDNGLGIDTTKHKTSLFKLFKRFHSHAEGRGLGLYLIKSQIESVNGTISLTSVVDKGTTFVIRLPEAIPPVESASNP